MNSSTIITTNVDENNLLIPIAIAKSSSTTQLSTTAQIVDEQVPICSICYGEFDPTNFIVLDCSHAFHRECIKQWLNIQQKCPYCNQANVKAHNIVIQHRNQKQQQQDSTSLDEEIDQELSRIFLSSDEALRLALIAYDRELHASSKDPIEHAALEATFQKIRALTQSQQYLDKQNRKRRWECIKDLTRIVGIGVGVVAMAALFFYLCWFYWPLIEPYTSIVFMIPRFIIMRKIINLMENSRLVRYAVFSVLAIILLIYLFWNYFILITPN